MKNGVSTVAFLLLILFGFMFFPTSCGRKIGVDRFDFADMDVMAQVEGMIDGKEISATVFSFPRAEGEEIRASVLYHSPASLEGISITMEACGECSARLGDMTLNTGGLDGLIEPFMPLISPRTVYSVERTESLDEKIRICDENCDLYYVFDGEEGVLKSISGKYMDRDIDIRIKSFSLDFVFPE